MLPSSYTDHVYPSASKGTNPMHPLMALNQICGTLVLIDVYKTVTPLSVTQTNLYQLGQLPGFDKGSQAFN